MNKDYQVFRNFMVCLMWLLMLGMAACGGKMTQIPLTAGAVPPLIIEAYPVVDKSVDNPDHFEFNQRISRQVLEKRSAWRSPNLLRDQADASQILNRFGYRLEGSLLPAEHSMQLWRGQDLLLENIVRISRLQTNVAATDFLLMLEKANGGLFTLRKTGINEWKPGRYLSSLPALAGDRLVTAYESGGRAIVEADGKIIFSLRVTNTGIDSAVKGIWSWQDQWVLETRGQVTIEGQNLNRQLTCDESFGFNLIAGQPAFFCKKGKQTQLFYAGMIQDPTYAEVIHYRCCEPAAFNPGGNANMIWFYALVGNTWNYVEAGVYN